MDGQYTRKAFFWVLTAVFFITTILVVFYAFGYRFSLDKGIFIYGGSITIKSNPRDVKISLNGEEVPNKKINYLNSSYHLDGIRPGEYLLEVSALGFQKWSKKISIHSGVSTEFWNVILARDEYPKTRYSVNCSEKFYLSPQDEFLVCPSNLQNSLEINFLDIESSESEVIFSADNYIFTNDQEENIEWSPDSDFIMVPAIKKDEDERDYFIIDIEKKETVNLSDISKEKNLSMARWDPENKTGIFFLSGRKLISIDIDNPEKKELISDNVSSYVFASGDLFYCQYPSNLVFMKNLLTDKTIDQITTSPPENSQISEYKIIAYDKNRIAFLDKNTRALYIWNKGEKSEYFRKLDEKVSGIQFSDDGKKMLFWNDWEVFVYFTREWEVQPSRQENEVLNISRFSQSIKNVHWAEDYEHVIFSTDKKIKIAELDRRDYVNIFDIAPLESDKEIVISDFRNKNIFFTDRNNENESEFGLSSIQFPEKEGLLGIIK